MKLFEIYLAGGMTGMTEEECSQWRVEVKNILEELESKLYKIAVINPVEYFNFFVKSHETEREIREFDLYKVKNSKLIIVNFNAPNSIGTAQELAIASELRIPIIGLNEDEKDIHPWLTECCNRVFTDKMEMLRYVNNYYLN